MLVFQGGRGRRSYIPLCRSSQCLQSRHRSAPPARASSPLEPGDCAKHSKVALAVGIISMATISYLPHQRTQDGLPAPAAEEGRGKEWVEHDPGPFLDCGDANSPDVTNS